MADLGTDLACVSDLSPTMATVSGRRALAEAIARRLQTPRGRLLRYPDYGFDLAGEINGDVDATQIASIKDGVEAECLKDERVLAASAVVTYTGDTLTVVITLTDAQGPFVLVLAVSGVTVTLLSAGT